MIPRATYRIQFNRDFGFADGARILAYLSRLGISHLYSSPFLKARAGSSHGYDIVDHGALNPELGGETAFQDLAAALKANSLGHILDFVPNHMGVGGADNQLWLDTLEWGVAYSSYARWFDIDWEPYDRYLYHKLLIPFLGNQYGIELEQGKLLLRFEESEGTFSVYAYDTHKLPIYPLHYARILGDSHPELERLGDAFTHLEQWRPQVMHRSAELKSELARAAKENPEVREAIAVAIGRLNGTPGDAASWRSLNRLIEDQHWRAAYFRVAVDDINYRRFFNINELAGLRMELPEVFEHAHRLVFSLLRDGSLDGLRIDHIDGLFDPKEYLEKLRVCAFGREACAFYLVVEKILARHESLREDWPVEGTTGYEFANLVLELLLNPAGEPELTRSYQEFTGEAREYSEIVRESKARIMQHEMASELNVLARDAARIARQNPRTSDFTYSILRRTLKQVVACFPVYRIYIGRDGVMTEADRRDLEWAIAQARGRDPELSAAVFDFAGKLLSAALVAEPRTGYSRQDVIRFAMRFQQYCGPVMAKGVEDTAFYRWNRFIALNEVGGNPDQFGISVGSFHKANMARARRWPHTMLATSTHDTKRGEDTRARLAVLSEFPDEWARQTQTWSRILRAGRRDIGAAGPPDRNDEYGFYQLLLGTWPAELTGRDAMEPPPLADYTARLKTAMVKSIREAKVHSTWAAPNLKYESAVLEFIEGAMDPEHGRAFLAAFLPFQERIARLGARNSLTQLVLKLTAPGIPDMYQGSELWDLSLMDPDNRRHVDYSIRERMLESYWSNRTNDRSQMMRGLLREWRDGCIKMAVTAEILNFRRENPALFESGDYEPLAAEGPDADHICAYARNHEGKTLVVAVTRWPGALEGRERLCQTNIAPPYMVATARWRDVLTNSVIESVGGLGACEILRDLPFAVLTAEA